MRICARDSPSRSPRRARRGLIAQSTGQRVRGHGYTHVRPDRRRGQRSFASSRPSCCPPTTCCPIRICDTREEGRAGSEKSAKKTKPPSGRGPEGGGVLGGGG